MATSVDSLSIQISASTKSAKDRVDALCESLDHLVRAINALDTSKFDTLANLANSLSTGLAGLKGTGVKQIEKIGKALDSISNEKTALDPIVQGEREIAEEAKNATQSEDQMLDSLKKFDATPLEVVSQSIGKVSDSLSTTTQKMSAFKSFLAGIKIIVPTESLDNVNKKIDKLSNKVAELKEKLAYNSQNNPDYIDSKEMEKDQATIQGLINELERLKLKKQELESHGGFKFGWNTSFSEIGRSVQAANKALSSFASKLHISKSATRETAKANNEFKLSADRLVKSLTRVTKMLKLMVTRMALRAVIKEVGNGFKSLALHSEEFNASMSGLINASMKLGYSFAGMVGPLINALAPALTYIISLLTKLMNIINQVFSSLSGKGTYNRAKDFTENWADNIQSANKQAKELKKTVLGFDELNQLQEKQTSGGDTSGNIEDMFETVAIENKWRDVANYIKNLAKRLFDPIKKAWDKVGDFVKKSWKYAMEQVLELGKSIARDFWKVWEQEKTQKIFENILKIIGYIGQAVGNLAKRFREAWDKNDTGLHILENIRDVILIITDRLVNMAKATAEWADNLDFSPLLEKFNEWLESIKPVVDNLMGIVEDFYTTVILPLAEWAIEKGGPQLLQVFIDFNNKVDWEGLKDKLKTLWEHLEPFAEKVGEGLIIFIDRVAQALADFINSQEFEDFLKAIEDWMDKVTPQDVADGLEAICKAILGFVAVKSVLSVLSAVAGFCTTIAALGGVLKLAIIISVAYGSYKLGGLLGKWLTDDDELYDKYTLPVVLEWSIGEFPTSWEDFGDKLHDWVDAWQDMREEADLFVRLITELVEGPVVSKLLDIWRIIKNGDDFVPDFSGGSGTGINDDEWQKTIDAAKEATEATKNAKTAGDDFKGTLQELSEKAKNTKTETDGIKSSFGNVYEEMKKANAETQNTSSSFGKAYESLKNVDTVSKITKTSLVDVMNSYKNTANVQPVFTASQKKIEESLKNVATETDKLATTTKIDWTNIPIEVANAELSMSGTMQEMSLDVDSASEDITKSTDEIKKAFDKKEWTFEGVGEGLKKTFEDAKRSIKSVWNSIADKINGEYEFGGGKFKVKLPTFAYGGFPEEDGLFLANHTEMVGRFSNGKTAVANNAEIVEGISQGVYGAVTSAMSRVGGNERYIANTIVVDGEVIARTVTKAQNNQNRRYSPQTV